MCRVCVVQHSVALFTYLRACVPSPLLPMLVWDTCRDPSLPTLAAATAVQRKNSDGVLDFAQL